MCSCLVDPCEYNVLSPSDHDSDYSEYIPSKRIDVLANPTISIKNTRGNSKVLSGEIVKIKDIPFGIKMKLIKRRDKMEKRKKLYERAKIKFLAIQRLTVNHEKQKKHLKAISQYELPCNSDSDDDDKNNKEDKNNNSSQSKFSTTSREFQETEFKRPKLSKVHKNIPKFKSCQREEYKINKKDKKDIKLKIKINNVSKKENHKLGKEPDKKLKLPSKDKQVNSTPSDHETDDMSYYKKKYGLQKDENSLKNSISDGKQQKNAATSDSTKESKSHHSSCTANSKSKSHSERKRHEKESKLSSSNTKLKSVKPDECLSKRESKPNGSTTLTSKSKLSGNSSCNSSASLKSSKSKVDSNVSTKSTDQFGSNSSNEGSPKKLNTTHETKEKWSFDSEIGTFNSNIIGRHPLPAIIQMVPGRRLSNNSNVSSCKSPTVDRQLSRSNSTSSAHSSGNIPETIEEVTLSSPEELPRDLSMTTLNIFESHLQTDETTNQLSTASRNMDNNLEIGQNRCSNDNELSTFNIPNQMPPPRPSIALKEPRLHLNQNQSAQSTFSLDQTHRRHTNSVILSPTAVSSQQSKSNTFPKVRSTSIPEQFFQSNNLQVSSISTKYGHSTDSKSSTETNSLPQNLDYRSTPLTPIETTISTNSVQLNNNSKPAVIFSSLPHIHSTSHSISGLLGTNSVSVKPTSNTSILNHSPSLFSGPNFALGAESVPSFNFNPQLQLQQTNERGPTFDLPMKSLMPTSNFGCTVDPSGSLNPLMSPSSYQIPFHMYNTSTNPQLQSSFHFPIHTLSASSTYQQWSPPPSANAVRTDSFSQIQNNIPNVSNLTVIPKTTSQPLDRSPTSSQLLSQYSADPNVPLMPQYFVASNANSQMYSTPSNLRNLPKTKPPITNNPTSLTTSTNLPFNNRTESVPLNWNSTAPRITQNVKTPKVKQSLPNSGVEWVEHLVTNRIPDRSLEMSSPPMSSKPPSTSQLIPETADRQSAENEIKNIVRQLRLLVEEDFTEENLYKISHMYCNLEEILGMRSITAKTYNNIGRGLKKIINHVSKILAKNINLRNIDTLTVHRIFRTCIAKEQRFDLCRRYLKELYIPKVTCFERTKESSSPTLILLSPPLSEEFNLSDTLDQSSNLGRKPIINDLLSPRSVIQAAAGKDFNLPVLNYDNSQVPEISTTQDLHRGYSGLQALRNSEDLSHFYPNVQLVEGNAEDLYPNLQPARADEDGVVISTNHVNQKGKEVEDKFKNSLKEICKPTNSKQDVLPTFTNTLEQIQNPSPLGHIVNEQSSNLDNVQNKSGKEDDYLKLYELYNKTKHSLENSKQAQIESGQLNVVSNFFMTLEKILIENKSHCRQNSNITVTNKTADINSGVNQISTSSSSKCAEAQTTDDNVKIVDEQMKEIDSDNLKTSRMKKCRNAEEMEVLESTPRSGAIENTDQNNEGNDINKDPNQRNHSNKDLETSKNTNQNNKDKENAQCNGNISIQEPINEEPKKNKEDKQNNEKINQVNNSEENVQYCEQIQETMQDIESKENSQDQEIKDKAIRNSTIKEIMKLQNERTEEEIKITSSETHQNKKGKESNENQNRTDKEIKNDNIRDQEIINKDMQKKNEVGKTDDLTIHKISKGEDDLNNNKKSDKVTVNLIANEEITSGISDNNNKQITKDKDDNNKNEVVPTIIKATIPKSVPDLPEDDSIYIEDDIIIIEDDDDEKQMNIAAHKNGDICIKITDSQSKRKNSFSHDVNHNKKLKVSKFPDCNVNSKTASTGLIGLTVHNFSDVSSKTNCDFPLRTTGTSSGKINNFELKNNSKEIISNDISVSTLTNKAENNNTTQKHLGKFEGVIDTKTSIEMCKPTAMPIGKLYYSREKNTLIRYFDKNQQALYMMNLKELNGAPSGMNVNTNYKLPLGVVFSEFEKFSNPQHYIDELALAHKYAPEDFAKFYAFVTRYQIFRRHDPITFQMFLAMFNTNRLSGLLKKFQIAMELPGTNEDL